MGVGYAAAHHLTVLVVGDREQIEKPLRALGHALTALDAEGTVV